MSGGRPKRTRLRAGGKPAEQRLSDDAMEAIEAALGYAFKDKLLLQRAMTHPSALSSAEAVRHSNQRLEFLGDRVLGLVIAERLFERYPAEREGSLAPRLNRLVNKTACADAVRYVGVADYILMADNEIRSGGRERDSTLGDVCESLIAAIYLDGGLKAARAFIERAWAQQFNAAPKRVKDNKTLLQELAQGRGLGLPVYKVVDRDGPDHAPVFRISVEVAGVGKAEGSSDSKQDAERAAAGALLDKVEDK